MNNQNLIPPSSMSAEQLREIRSRGGRVCTEKKKLAAQLRELKKKGYTEETSNKILEIIANPENSKIKIYGALLEMEPEVRTKDIKTRLAWIDRLTELHSVIYGKAASISFNQITNQNNLQINHLEVSKIIQIAEESKKREQDESRTN